MTSGVANKVGDDAMINNAICSDPFQSVCFRFRVFVPLSSHTTWQLALYAAVVAVFYNDV